MRLVNPSVTSHWELIDVKEAYSIDPVGPVVGDMAKVVLHAACSGLGIAMLPDSSVVDFLRSVS